MAETIPQLPTGLSPILELPNELIDQIARELSDKNLGNFRVTSKCFHDITLAAWKKRALQDKGGYPALEWAAEHNKPSLIDYLLGVFPDMEVNIPQGTRDISPLRIACGVGSTQAAWALINRGADVNYVPAGRSALVQAVRGGHDMMVQMLLEKNADPNTLDYRVSNIVQVAARLNHVQTLQVILARMRAYPESMPGINDFNAQGLTALHFASGAGATGAATLLLESGADVDRTCNRNRFETPLARAVRVPTLERVKMVTLLLSRGANVEGRTNETLAITNFDTPLHLAIRGRRLPDSYDLASLLIGRGAALNVLDHAGCPTLHAALLNRDLSMMRLIVDGGGDVNMVDEEGSSALHLLASLDIDAFTGEAVPFFRQKGADMFLVNNVGMTARDLAQGTGWDAEAIEATWGSGA